MESHSTFSSHPEGSKMKFWYTISIYERPVGVCCINIHQLKWRIFFYIFQPLLWLFIIVAFVFMNGAWILLKVVIHNDFHILNFECIIQTYISVGKTIVCVGLNNVPSSDSEGIFLAGCFWFGIVLMTSLTSQVFSLTISKPSPPQLNTLQEIADYLANSSLKVLTRYTDNVTRIFNGSILAPLIPQLLEDNEGVKSLVVSGVLSVLEKCKDLVFTILTPPIAGSVSRSNVTDVYFAKESFQTVHVNLFSSFKWGKYTLCSTNSSRPVSSAD